MEVEKGHLGFFGGENEALHKTGGSGHENLMAQETSCEGVGHSKPKLKLAEILHDFPLQGLIINTVYEALQPTSDFVLHRTDQLGGFFSTLG